MRKALAVLVRTVLGLAAAVVALLAIGYVQTRGDYPVPRTVADDPSLPSVLLNGRLFHAEAFGRPAAPVVIVVHGGPGWDYRGLLSLKALSDSYYVVFYDQRGSGLSARVDTKELDLESTLSDLDAFVDHYGGGRKVDLIGHSWGAMVVSGYLGRHPEKVRRAVLAEPGFLTTEMMKRSGVRFGPLWEWGFLVRASKAWFRSLHITGPDADAASDYFLGEVAPYANPEYYCPDTDPAAASAHWRTGSQAATAIPRSAMDERGEMHIDLVRGVERFTEPVLFLTTECNRSVGRAHQEEQAKLFPRARIEVVARSGHAMFAERPDESVRIVRAYLNGR